MHQIQTARKQGLYDPQYEHDACGIAMFANIRGNRSQSIVAQALEALVRMNHRGGRGADPELGDGAGILTQLPDRLLRGEWERAGKSLPRAGQYGVGMLFLPSDPAAAHECENLIAAAAKAEKLEVLGWRDVPVDASVLCRQAKETMPAIRQVFIAAAGGADFDDDALERALYQVRRRAEKAARETLPESLAESVYIVSLSSRTIVYKGLLTPDQLRSFFKDLTDERYDSAVALVHNRFSTNTFPSWKRAQPFRVVAHNGEINTINGNINWMIAREAAFESKLLTSLDQVRPVIDLTGSDSAMFDNVLELLVMSGRSLPHALMMMIPEPWHNIRHMDEVKRAFYEFHSTMMEPWDGPAAMVFSDGVHAGACLDRNGLRPARFVVTNDDHVYVSSEVGVVDVPEEKIVRKDRLRPGQMLIVDLKEGRLLLDDEIKHRVASAQPYREWVKKYIVPLAPKASSKPASAADRESWMRQLKMFGYTFEEWHKVLKPMALTGAEPTGSMGYDAPLAVLSERPQLLFSYFKQRFAQVTNPPIDAIREELVTTVETLIGPEGNLLEPNPADYAKVRLHAPVMTEAEYDELLRHFSGPHQTEVIETLFPHDGGDEALEKAIGEMLQQAERAVERGCRLIILSDRGAGRERVPMPSLLAVSAVHQHLVRTGKRTKVSLIAESGEPREVHHFAALLGFGANAVYPYLIWASLPYLANEERTALSPDKLAANYVTAVSKGILKIMSKMGISVLQSYIGAQVFEAIGIAADVMERFFPRTSSQVGGLGLAEIAREARMRHEEAFSPRIVSDLTLDPGSDMQWRAEGEEHLYRPETIHTLQQACRTGSYELYKTYSRLFAEEHQKPVSLRDLLEFKPASGPIPIEEVEPVESILARFKSGAMSFGSISQEAHEAIAIAMNRLGARSNSGEGGEDPARYVPLPNGDSKNSKIKQVASGRFGVSSLYLVNCEEIQIKMAQGAKPGEGGQLAGHKITPQVAKTRGSIPGIELISPPPHHDIYSIEDLAQLIHDLKHANPRARINVKLVSGAGVGTIAAGVAKAKADVILISGYEGGTGAAPRTSIKHAGMPWELGLADAHQTLMLNGLRNRVRLEVDGKLMNGRDVVIAALLGAEEFGFSTLPLVSLGCVMMRVCHLDTCPVGIATQNPELRAKFAGKPEHVMNLMRFIAQEVREIMAELGFRTMDEMIGRTDCLKQKETRHWKAQKLDLSPLLWQPEGPRKFEVPQEHGVEQCLDARVLIPLGRKAWETGNPVYGRLSVRNTDRAVGTLLGSELTRRMGAEGLPEHSIHFHMQGSAGHSFGAFLPGGITLTLEGEAGDGVGKGLSGGKLAIYPDAKSRYRADEQVIVGNAAFYGAVAGEAFISGQAGERFCIRNSGATVVVEGIGDHGCEYMTGGMVVVLGAVGKNFAAGMSGGMAYVMDTPETRLREHINTAMVLIEPLSELREREQEKLHRLIERHWQYTGSEAAKRILQRWEQAKRQFVRVIPTEYKRLTEMAETGDEVNVHG